MARGSDIDFAKLGLIFNFTKKEDIYAAIREVALLKELGINKRLAHVMYERRFLTVEQIQSILWVLLKVGRIRRFPARIVYEFSQEEDKKFLAQVKTPFNEILAQVDLNLSKSGAKKEEKKQFPLEALIFCQDIQKKLKQKNFDRSLLSILSARGYLTEEYRNLIPDIQEKKTIISSPKHVKEEGFGDRCEVFLFNALLTIKGIDVSSEKKSEAFSLWEKIHGKMDIRYGEVLYYLGCSNKNDLNQVGIVLRELTGINQTPRLEFLDQKASSYALKHEKYKENYPEIFTLAEELSNMGFQKLGVGNVLLHQELLDTEEFKQEKQADTRANITQKEFQEATQFLRKSEKRKLVRSFIPFSFRDLEKEFEKLYLEERLAARKYRPKHAGSIVEEWAQTEILSFKEMESTESTPLPRDAKPHHRVQVKSPLLKPEDAGGEGTDYIHLPLEGAEEIISEPTEYISIEGAGSEKLKFLSERVEDTMIERGSVKLLLWTTFVMAMGISIVMPNLKILLGNTDKLPIYSGLSIFIMCVPGILLSSYFGKMADRGKVHVLISVGLFIHGIGTWLLVYGLDIYTHLLIRVFQAVGLTAISIGLEFCIGRWFGVAERGRMLGLFAVFGGLGSTCGYLLCPIFEGLESTFSFIEPDKVGFTLASFLSMVLCLVTIFYAHGAKVSAVIDEDAEEEEFDWENSPIPKIPLFAVALYGIVEMGLLVVFLPTFNQKISNLPVTEDTLVLWLGLGSLVSGYVFGRLSDKIGPLPILRVLTFLAIVSLFLVPHNMTNISTIQLIFFFIGISIGAIHPLGFSWVLEVMDDERHFGAAAGAFTLFLNLGAMFGCIFCGVAFYFLDLSYFFLLLTLIFIAYFYFLLLVPLNANNDDAMVGGLLRFLNTSGSDHL